MFIMPLSLINVLVHSVLLIYLKSLLYESILVLRSHKIHKRLKQIKARTVKI